MVCEIIEVTGDPQPTGKELVIEFSGSILSTLPLVIGWVNKIVELLGGKEAYIEDQVKLVVVL